MNLLALVLATTVAGLGPSAALPEPLPSNSYKLDNGLTVVLHLDRTVPLVAVRVLYRVGSADDPPGKQGMVHLMEHALFHGSEHLEGSVRNELGRMSAVRSNGVTTPDFMQLFELVPATNLSAALRLEADRMGFYEFDSIHIGTEKLIVNREMAERAQRSPWETVLRAAHTKLYDPTHSLHPASAETVAPISVLDLEDLAARALDPSNAVLALAGDLPSDTRDQVEQYFGGLDSTPVALPKPPMPRAITAEVRLSVDGGHDTAPRVVLAWRAPRVGEPMAAVATLAAAVLRRTPARGPRASVATQRRRDGGDRDPQPRERVRRVHCRRLGPGRNIAFSPRRRPGRQPREDADRRTERTRARGSTQALHRFDRAADGHARHASRGLGRERCRG